MSTDPTPAKTSKQTTERTTKSRHLLAAMRQWKPSLGASPAKLALLEELTEDLEASIDALVRADEELYDERARVAELRRRRDATSKRLGDMLVGLRFSTLGQYEEPDLVGLGFEKHTPREPDPQLRQGDRLVESFRGDRAALMLGHPLFRETSFDGKAQVGHLEDVTKQLRDLLTDVETGKRKIALALVGKHEAMASYDRTYRHTLRIFEDLCRLAGKDELADRVRVRSPRRSPPERALSASSEAGETLGNETSPVPERSECEALSSPDEACFELTQPATMTSRFSAWSDSKSKTRSSRGSGKLEPR